MSLIDEALKRARHEASRQEAVKRDAARHDGPRPIPRLYAERQTSRAPLWAGIATGAAVALLGVIAWLLWGRSPNVAAPAVAPLVVAEAPAVSAPPARPEPPVAAAPLPSAVPSVPKEAAPAPRVSRPAPPPAAPTASAAIPAAVPSAAPVAPTPTRDPAEKKPSAPPAAPAPKPASAPRSGSTSAASAALQTYVREATLPGGGPHFRLGGIAYSEEAPIALINGAALGRGEVVEGYVVRRIDAAEVELEGPGGRVVLRLK